MDEDTTDLIYICWNMEDYPIPASADLVRICHDIISAVQEMGFDGRMELLTFGDKLNDYDPTFFDSTGINDIRKDKDESHGIEGDSPVGRMTQQIIYTCFEMAYPDPVKYVLIAKQHSGSEFHRVLKCLKSRGSTIAFVEPRDDDAFSSVESIIACTQLFGGEKLTRVRSSTPYTAAATPMWRMVL